MDISLKCGRDLKSHKIVWIVDSPAFLIRRIKPTFSDYRDECVTETNAFFDCLYEIFTRTKSVDIIEDLTFGKAFSKSVINASSQMTGIITAITAENLTVQHSIS